MASTVLQSLARSASMAARRLPDGRAALFSSLSGAGAGDEPALCGRGDKRTKKGKRFKGSFGNARPKLKQKIERIKDRVEVPQGTPWPLPFKLI